MKEKLLKELNSMLKENAKKLKEDFEGTEFEESSNAGLSIAENIEEMDLNGETEIASFECGYRSAIKEIKTMIEKSKNGVFYPVICETCKWTGSYDELKKDHCPECKSDRVLTDCP